MKSLALSILNNSLPPILELILPLNNFLCSKRGELKHPEFFLHCPCVMGKNYIKSNLIMSSLIIYSFVLYYLLVSFIFLYVHKTSSSLWRHGPIIRNMKVYVSA